MMIKYKRYDGSETYTVRTRPVEGNVKIKVYEKHTALGRTVSEESSVFSSPDTSARYLDTLDRQLTAQGFTVHTRT